MNIKKCLSILSVLGVVSALTACGGGGGSDGGNGSTPLTSQNTSSAGGQTTSSTPCANVSGTTDVWLPNRLNCFTVGEQVLSFYGAGGSTDTAVILNEKVYDTNFNNVLGGDKARYFKYFACLKNVPTGLLADSGTRITIATDISIAARTSNSSSKGSQIGQVTIGMYGGNQAGYVNQTCDTTRHPLIIDYATGKVISVNSQALNAVETYDY